MVPSKITVLVADDSQVVHRMFANAVAAWPKPVVMVTAFDGLQCLAACERHAIDVAFIDVGMPEMSGWRRSHDCATAAIEPSSR